MATGRQRPLRRPAPPKQEPIPPAAEDPTVTSINVIGAGRVGRTLARLATQYRLWEVRGVLNRSPASAAEAVRFIGAGQAVEDWAQLQRADLVMISTSDAAIEPCCRRLCEADLAGEGVTVFHCSGALPSAVLEPAGACGAAIASAHLVKSFADPAAAVESFAGTFCGLEGDEPACRGLGEAFESLGARTFALDPDQKTIYHAGTVIVCNYLTALIETGLRCFEQAGVPRTTATEVIEPLVRGTVENAFRLGPTAALTGPIARGEADVVARQCQALGAWAPDVEQIYKALGQAAADLSAAQGTASAVDLAAIRELLTPLPPGEDGGAAVR